MFFFKFEITEIHYLDYSLFMLFILGKSENKKFHTIS